MNTDQRPQITPGDGSHSHVTPAIGSVEDIEVLDGAGGPGEVSGVGKDGRPTIGPASDPLPGIGTGTDDM
jgi:hypothetical protein